MPVSLIKRLIAEFLGTFWLVFGGCGAAVLAEHEVPPVVEKPVTYSAAS